MEGQGIEDDISYEPSYMLSDDNKPNDSYISRKKDDSLIKSSIRGTLAEGVLYIVSGLSTALCTRY